MHVKAYIIYGNNKDTEQLIEHLHGKDNGTITIIDDEIKGLKKQGDLTYATKSYVDAIQDKDIPLVYYHYIQPMQRKDGRKWRREERRQEMV